MPKVASTTLGSTSRITGDSRVQCPQCGKSIKARQFARHEQIHLPENLKSWTQCPFPGCSRRVSSFQWNNIHSHIRRDHNKKPLQCPLCPKTSFHEATMSRHYKDVHPGIQPPRWPKPDFPEGFVPHLAPPLPHYSTLGLSAHQGCKETSNSSAGHIPTEVSMLTMRSNPQDLLLFSEFVPPASLPNPSDMLPYTDTIITEPLPHTTNNGFFTVPSSHNNDNSLNDLFGVAGPSGSELECPQGNALGLTVLPENNSLDPLNGMELDYPNLLSFEDDSLLRKWTGRLDSSMGGAMFNTNTTAESFMHGGSPMSLSLQSDLFNYKEKQDGNIFATYLHEEPLGVNVLDPWINSSSGLRLDGLA